LQAGLEPVFYRITRELTIDWDDLLSKVSADAAAVVVIHFFGIEARFDQLDEFRRDGVAVIEDWSHSFLKDEPIRLAGSGSDFRIYSFWKLLPLIAGGALARDGARTTPAPGTVFGRVPLWHEIKLAKRLFEAGLQNSEHTTAKAVFSLAENLRLALKGSPSRAMPTVTGSGSTAQPDMQLSNMPMPRVCQRLMLGTELSDVAQARRGNYLHYSRLLRGVPGIGLPFPEPGGSSCPWLFPMIVEDRERFSDYCRNVIGLVPQTFGAILHESLYHGTDAGTVADAKYLADHVVCLPIHQDLGASDVDGYGCKLLEYFRNDARKLPCTQ
jgi:dTDP-4-amino-4,6-dideoxygalactose transaminase